MVREQGAERCHDAATGVTSVVNIFSPQVSRHTWLRMHFKEGGRSQNSCDAASALITRESEPLTLQAGETNVVCLTSRERLSASLGPSHFPRVVDLLREQVVERRAIIHMAAREDGGDPMGVRDVRQWVALQQHKIGELARLDRA